MILCFQCGYQNRDGSLFCTQCGVKLSQTEKSLARVVVMSKAHTQATYPLLPAKTIIGRDEFSDIVLEDPLVSAQHARISYDLKQFWIEDLSSTNGTLINGEKIMKKSLLKDGYLIKIGGALMKFLVGNA